MIEDNDTALEKLEETIMVLETMTFGNGFCRTELEALKCAIMYLKRIKDLYIKK